MAVAIVMTATASAQQNNRSAYFMDSYLYSYRFNPAFTPEKGHVGLLLGNIGIGAESDLDSRIFFSKGSNGLDVGGIFDDPSKYLKYVGESNSFHLDFDMDFLSVAFRTGNLFHSFDVTSRSNSYVKLPYEVAELASMDFDSDEINIKDINDVALKSQNYLQFAYGISTSLFENLSIGARVKFLVGMMQFDARLDHFGLDMSDDVYDVNVKGEIQASLPKFVQLPEKNGYIDVEEIGFEEDVTKIVRQLPSGLGVSFDAGAAWKFADYFTLSASVLDLGFINWSNSITAELSDFTFDEDSDAELADFIRLRKDASGKRPTRGIEGSVNAGLEFNMPFYQNLSVGVFGTTHLNGPYTWGEARGVVDWYPCNGIEMAFSGGASTYGAVFGAALNLRLAFINLFVGADSLMPALKLVRQDVPESRINANLTFGLNIAFGKKH